MATTIPLTDSWIWALILAVTRRARCVTVRAIRRKLNAKAAATGAMIKRSSVSRALMVISHTARNPTSMIWLRRLVVSVTTSDRSWVSDVTRLTIFPEGCSS